MSEITSCAECGCPRESARLAPGAPTSPVPLDTVRGILYERQAASHLREHTSDAPIRTAPGGHRVLAWLGLHRKTLAFSAGLGVVLVAIALFSLAGSGAKSTTVAPASQTTVQPPASSENGGEASEQLSSYAALGNEESVEPARSDDSAKFLESVIWGKAQDAQRATLVSQLRCQAVCHVTARTLSTSGDVSVAVIAAISEDGTVSARSVIVEGSGGEFRIRQIIQPATQSATG